MLDNPDITIAEIMQIMPGPDFPTAGIILGRAGIRQAYETGRGSVLIRGRGRDRGDARQREAIIITEIPYQVNKSTMIEKIAELVRDKRIEGISDIRDESDRHGMRVVIELKRDAVPDVVLNQLYRFTPLQSSFGCNFVALNGGRPELMNLREILSAFVDFREEVVTRRTRFLLGKARDRAHVLVGLAVAVANIDEVIALIRARARSGDGARGADGARLAGAGRGAADRADRRSAPQHQRRRHLPPVRRAGPRHPRAALQPPDGARPRRDRRGAQRARRRRSRTISTSCARASGCRRSSATS